MSTCKEGMHICVNVCYVGICNCICWQMHQSACVHMHVMYACLHKYMYICAHVCVHACLYTHHVCVYACMNLKVLTMPFKDLSVLFHNYLSTQMLHHKPILYIIIYILRIYYIHTHIYIYIYIYII